VLTPLPVALAQASLEPFLDLNNAHPIEVGPALTAAEFARLVAIAFYARGYNTPPGFLLALDQNAPYDNANFAWFKSRHARFAYVDRVLIDGTARGRGFATALYDDLFAAARAAGHTIVCAEINSDPPNPASDAFHAALGFETVGTSYLPHRDRTVRYICRPL
jgi:uncharacterized protein